MEDRTSDHTSTLVTVTQWQSSYMQRLGRSVSAISTAQCVKKKSIPLDKHKCYRNSSEMDTDITLEVILEAEWVHRVQ